MRGKIIAATVAGVGVGAGVAYPFFRADTSLWAGRLTRERKIREEQAEAIRAVYQDLTIDVPPEVAAFAARVRDRLTQNLTRGRE